MKQYALLTFCLYASIQGQVNAFPNDNSDNSAGSAQSASSANALYEVLGRVEQLQSEVQQLRGIVEEQAQTISDLERKQRNMYSDLDGRVQALSPVDAQPPKTAQVTPSATTPSSTVDNPPQAAAAPVTTGTAAVNQAASVAPPTSIPSSTKGNEKERYQVAYDTLRNGHNDQSIKMFETFLIDYPEGEFADNAQYWLGEAYKLNRDYDKARQAFNKVVSQYPNSAKVPDALLKIGYIEADLQNNVKARDYLTRVATSYPGTTAAHLAAKKLSQMTQ